MLVCSSEEILDNDWYWDTLVSHWDGVGPLKMIGLSSNNIIQSEVGTTSPMSTSTKIIGYLSKNSAPKLDGVLQLPPLSWESFDQSMQQPRYFIAEMEQVILEDPNGCDNYKEVGCIKDICTCYTMKPKTIVDSQGVVMWLGKYK